MTRPYRRLRPLTLVLPVLFALATSGCMGMADHQSARTVGAGNIEITSGASLAYSRVDSTEHAGTSFGLRAAYGITPWADVLVGGTAFRRPPDEAADPRDHQADPRWGYGLTAGPKLGIVPNRLALYVPVSILLDEDFFGTRQFLVRPLVVTPTVLTTIPVSSEVDIVPSAKAVVPLNNTRMFGFLFGDDYAYGLNLGLGWRPAGWSGWTLRPEAGIVLEPDIARTRFVHASIGVSRRF